MRTILLSFQPHWYRQIMCGNKIFEYRWQFPNEEVMAYTYVSKPQQQIVGYMKFCNKISIEDLMDQYKGDNVVLVELAKKMEHNRFVMNVCGYQETRPIELNEIKKEFPNFVIPQSYYYLDNFPELFEYIKGKAILKGKMKFNDFRNVQSHSIGTGLLT